MMPSSKRLRCKTCTRPLSTCLCKLIAKVSHQTDVLILRHPSETLNAKNTASLLALCLTQCRVIEGESFDQAALKTWLYAEDKIPLLLFPDSGDHVSLGILPTTPYEGSHIASQLRLVIIDGTWRKCRKMLYLNKPLQALPRLSLTDCAASRYVIRKAEQAHQLSTLEAACYALEQLEQRSFCQPILNAFDQFIDQHLSFTRPKGTNGNAI